MAYKALKTGGAYVGKQTYKGLTSTGFQLNWLFVLIVAVYFYFKGKGGSGDKDVSTDVRYDVDNMTITVEQARMYAKRLLDAMNQVGKDSDVIYDVFGLFKTVDDFKAVYVEFGIKPYNGYGVSTDLDEWLELDFDYDLIQWLKEEVNSVLNPLTYRRVKDVLESFGYVF